MGNLPVTIKPKQLKTLFTEYGTVDSVRLRNVPVDPEGKMPRGGKVITGKFVENRKSTNAYVVFKEEKAVDAACANRSDLRKKALARVSAIHKAGRVARAKK